MRGGKLRLEHAYELKRNHWRAEVCGFYLMFLYSEGMLYIGMSDREDELQGKLCLVAINTNPIELIRLKNILDLLQWECDNYYEE